MYLLCSCGAVFERYGGGSSPKKMNHFKMKGHEVIGRYTFLENIPGHYFLIGSGRPRKYKKLEEI